MGKSKKNYKNKDFPKIKRPQKSKKDKHSQLHPYERWGPHFYDEDVKEGEFEDEWFEEDNENNF